MRYIIGLMGLLFVLRASADCNAQEITVYERGSAPHIYNARNVDSIRFAPCDTVDHDYDGCDIFIDSVNVNVLCGNQVSVAAVFDGTPSDVVWSIYDMEGSKIITGTHTNQFIFTLPGPGVYYGTVEASCGGGDANGGDEDEEAFEIINQAPVADFSLTSYLSCEDTICIRTIETTDYSQEDNLSYTYTVKDLGTGVTTIYNTAQPTYSLDPGRSYEVRLDVIDSKGCISAKTVTLDAQTTCQAKYDWSYSWCDSCADGSKTDVDVSFTNQSDNPNCNIIPVYAWDFGDNTAIDSTQSPTHTYKDVPCPGKAYTVQLTMTLGNPGDADYCKSVWDTVITISNAKVEISVVRICPDGLVHFRTSAVEGKWETPGSLNKPKWPAVFKNIRKILGIQIGQDYRQYYGSPGTYIVSISEAESENHNKCTPKRIQFTITEVKCYARNDRVKGDTIVDDVKIKWKFAANQWPLYHQMKAKVKSVGYKKFEQVSAAFDGVINKKDETECFSTPVPISDASGTLTNVRKAKAKKFADGRFRIGNDMATATFYIKTKANGIEATWQAKLSRDCDKPAYVVW